MDNITIFRWCRNDSFIAPTFFGVFSSDTVPAQLPHHCCMVVNTAKSYMPGEHWIALYKEGSILEIFDSFGAYYSFLNKLSYHIVSQKNQLQKTDSPYCGFYCLYFLYNRCRGVSYNSVCKDRLCI